MARINLKPLKQTSTDVQTSVDQPLSAPVSFRYSDIQLDLLVGDIHGNFPTNVANNMTDIKVSYDYFAIKNAIENLFNSMPGQWILNPLLGIGLPRFLFNPIDESTGRDIAEAIIQNLTIFETRVKIQKIKVEGDPDNNVYNITLALQLQNVNTPAVMLQGTLDSSKFQFN